MKHNVELLKADILSELDKLDLIRKELESIAEKLELDSAKVPAYD